MVNQLYENYTAFLYYDDTFSVAARADGLTYLSQIFLVGNMSTNEGSILQQIDVYIGKGGSPTGLITLELREVTGTTTIGRILDSATLDCATLGADGWYSFTGFKGYSMRPSTRYAWLLRHETPDNTHYIKVFGSNHMDSASYSGGYAYYSKNRGLTWTTVFSDNDPEYFAFKIWGAKYDGTMAQYMEVTGKAGKGANVVALSTDNVGSYVLSAESLVNARTRKNWTDTYATLNVDVKYILDEIVSSLAAIKVINYDMSGYTSRLEAEGMKQTLWNEAEKYIEELKDTKVQTFIAGA